MLRINQDSSRNRIRKTLAITPTLLRDTMSSPTYGAIVTTIGFEW